MNVHAVAGQRRQELVDQPNRTRSNAVDQRPNALELDTLDSSATKQYSVCTLVTRNEQYHEMLASFYAAGFSEANSEFLYVDNTKANKCDAFAAIRRFLQAARGRYLILCHQDVRLHDDQRATLDQRLAELTRLDPNWALCGNAGGTRPGCLALRITDPHGQNTRCGDLPARVTSLDENFIVVRRSAGISVSRDLRGFHFYGTDLCIIADVLGYSSYVVDFHLWHLGGESQRGTARQHTFMSDFVQAKQRLIAKYARAFAPRWIQTTTATIFVSGLRPLNALANHSRIISLVKRLQRHKQK